MFTSGQVFQEDDPLARSISKGINMGQVGRQGAANAAKRKTAKAAEKRKQEGIATTQGRPDGMN
jgi:hypothetical protein